ncbi:unnamed protein product [Fraxinus pennsylvanica]|uniref:Uncharacterized protein n=1 Tax=Fraxinus pennsylvanica TaxID=56036 RepID=A0AAD2E0H9_9LAMI|nr:unnamed protein product [Fraxinus pennsylvanica]
MQKAWFYEVHGPKEVLKLGDFPIPYPVQNQLLVQVCAAALNPIDFKLCCNPLVFTDFPVGKGDHVSRFEVGDEVYGNIQNFNAEGEFKQLGTLAQFIFVEENLVASKPKNLSFQEAASFPVAVQTAVEGFKSAGFKEGQTIFIVGGAGGFGSLAVQLAKFLEKFWRS